VLRSYVTILQYLVPNLEIQSEDFRLIVVGSRKIHLIVFLLFFKRMDIILTTDLVIIIVLIVFETLKLKFNDAELLFYARTATLRQHCQLLWKSVMETCRDDRYFMHTVSFNVRLVRYFRDVRPVQPTKRIANE